MAFRLRELKKEDIDKTFRWHNDPDLARQILSFPPPIPLAEEQKWLQKILRQEDPHRLVRGIEVDSELVGLVQLHEIDHVKHRAYLGIFVGDKGLRSQGAGHQALESMLDYAKKTLHLKSIFLEVEVSNKQALEFYLRRGFSKVEKTPLTKNKHGTDFQLFILCRELA